jgi:hypothetical protein
MLHATEQDGKNLKITGTLTVLMLPATFWAVSQTMVTADLKLIVLIDPNHDTYGSMGSYSNGPNFQL